MHSRRWDHRKRGNMRTLKLFILLQLAAALSGCLDPEPDIDIASSSEAVTATVATVRFRITNTSSSSITLDRASCSPSASIFPPFSISAGSTAEFSATTTTSTLLLCTVRYQDRTGVQGCQFQVDQFPSLGFASANAYKGSSPRIPLCPYSGTAYDATTYLGVFGMQAL